MARDDPADADYADIRLDDLVVSESNVRHQDIVADVDQLAKNIEKHGLQHPIVVQQTDDGKYEILIGQRRHLAFKKLRRPSIPARVVQHQDPLAAKVLSFSENVQRRDLTPRDKAEACLYLYQELGSVRAVSDEVGVSEQTIRKWIGYAAVPDVLKTKVEEGKLTRGQASRIWAVAPKVEQAVEIGDLIGQKHPPKQEEDRILAAAEELPDQPLDTILDRAKERAYEMEIIFVLPRKWMKAIERAAGEYGKDPPDIAREATIEWLQAHELFAD